MTEYLDENYNPIDPPDLAQGSIKPESFSLAACYECDKEEVGHWVTIAEYPGGGKDVEWVLDEPEEGQWFYSRIEDDGCETFWNDAPLDVAGEDWWEKGQVYRYQSEQYQVYTPFTDEELKARAEEEAAAKEAAEEAQAAQEVLEATPDGLAELSEVVSTLETTNSDMLDAIAELSQLISDFMEANNG